MSWNFTVGPTTKDQWDAAVETAEVTGQDTSLPNVLDDVNAAKDCLKALVGRVKRDTVFASAGGHSLQPEEENNFYDGITISVSGQPT